MTKKRFLAILRHIFFPVFIALTSPVFLKAQVFHNLDFTQLCDTSKTGLCHWHLSWGGKGAISPQVIDTKNCLRIQGKNESSVGFVEQAASVSFPDTRILTVSAGIRSDSVEGKGAGLNIGLYDKDGNLLASKDMGGFYSLDWTTGTCSWKTCSISLVCPPETRKIKVGMILFGKGKVYYKNYKVTLVPIANRKPSSLAEKYISIVCDTIKMNSLVRDSIPIGQLKKTALQIAGPAKTYSDCYLAVNYLLESLRPFGDHHSFLMTARELKNWKSEGSQVNKIRYPAYQLVDSFAYITVPAFHGGNPALMLAYADSLQSAIRKLYHSGIKGWIVDLRENTGGNMSPMIAGLGPLFSSEKIGSLQDVNGKLSSWHYKNGTYFWDRDTGWKVSHPLRLNSRLPIAVLTGNQTGSSGEAVTVSFIGNAKTRSFGQATWGLTTGNGSFDLPDGSQIFLASTIMVDRNGRLYRESIVPDVVIDAKETGKNDPVMNAAMEWLSTAYRQQD